MGRSYIHLAVQERALIETVEVGHESGRVAGPLAHLISLPQPKPWVPRPFDSAQGRLLRFLQGRERYCRYNRA